MYPQKPAFVSAPLPASGLTVLSGTSLTPLSHRRVPVARPAPTHRSQICMQEKTKKKSALTFALDIKGNFVWTLRSASKDDIPSIGSMIGPNLPESIISVLVEDSPCCTVCEASVRGGKEADEFGSRVLGAALADVSIELRESGVVKRADFITVTTDPELPDRDDVSRKMVLGCLKKLKDAGCYEATSDVAADRTERISLLKSCLFKESENKDGRVKLVCKLNAENPDPQKKLM